jgi:hypothetical protein
LLDLLYYESAREYLRSLPLDHFMEATPQVHQRKISWDSLDLVHAQQPDLLHEVNEFKRLLQDEKRRADDAERRARAAEEEVTHLRAHLDRSE